MNRTPWDETAQAGQDAVPLPLTGDLHADVCVVGAGAAGLTTAYLLAREGHAVVVLDERGVVCGDTARSTAHLTTWLDDGWARIVRIHGEDLARLAARSHAAAIDRLEAITLLEEIDCGFERVDGWLCPQPGDDARQLDDELAAARLVGLPVEEVAHPPVRGLDTGRCLRILHQAQIDPARLLRGLAAAIARHGGRIYRARATELAGDGPVRVGTDRTHAVTAESVVLTTHAPLSDAHGLQEKQVPNRTYAIAGTVPPGTVPAALYWDMAEPFHYVRLVRGTDGGSDLLVVGGEDHRTGEGGASPQRWERLETWARSRFPMLGDVTHRWSGQILASSDGLGFIGRTSARQPVWIATGDSGTGITHGMIAGMLVSDYDPGRLRLRAVGELSRGALDVASHLGSWLTPGDVAAIDAIAPGSGAVVRRGLHKVAVYRGEDGAVVALSATCPHRGCIVAWNGAERTWDCPCHGSRFDVDGTRLDGPATRGLAPATDDDGTAAVPQVPDGLII
jgi:glycine/D-amino acid oxidase-like deaminating enzyme/nitrite reductase/ring-hydroxylating ferredoxin subunit